MAPRNYRAALADAPEPNPDEPGDPAALGDAGKRALDRANQRAKNEKQRADDLAAKLKEHDDAQLTDQQRADQASDELRKENEQLRRDKLRREVADEKGLTPAQARFLQGDTQDEIEASADDLLATFPAPKPEPAPDPTTKQPGRPEPKPRGGGNPDDPPEEMDPGKLAGAVRRGR